MTPDQVQDLCTELSLIRKAIEKLTREVEKLNEPPEIRLKEQSEAQ